MPIALSIRQPWVELILSGRKTIEVRSWATRHRGVLWLHAGKHPDAEALSRFDFKAADLTFGALIGTCELSDCIQFSVDSWESWRKKHLNPGSLERPLYAWVLENPTRINPVAYPGRLGLMKF